MILFDMVIKLRVAKKKKKKEWQSKDIHGKQNSTVSIIRNGKLLHKRT